MTELQPYIARIRELEKLLKQAEQKSDILTNLLKEASADFNQTLEKVTTSEENFRAIFENAPEAIYIIDVRTHRILDCNPFTAKWLGYPREQILSARVEDILETGASGIPENIRKALDSGYVHIQERRFQKRDGSLADAEITGTLIEYQGKTCFLALVRDITERKQIEELTRYKELFENVTDPVFINDAQGRFLEVNDVACSSLGFAREKMLELTLRELTPPSQLGLLVEAAESLQRQKNVQFELDIQTRMGIPIPYEIHSSRIHYKGSPCVLSVARNLSIRKKMEETLVKTERLLAVGEMASGVAHNFNNLLQMIMGSGEAALAKLGGGKIRECREAIESILNACRRGSGIVRRIKDFTLSNTHGMDEAQVFDLEELLSEALELTKPLWKTLPEPRTYRVNVIKCSGCYIKGKPTEIYEVLVNLIKNALEAMPDGGTLTVTSYIKNDKVYLEIADTGNGIGRENFQRIFEPFFTTKGSQNTGLGLSSSYGFIKRHLGDIRVQSTLGEGTTFTLVLPKSTRVQQEEIEAAPLTRLAKIRFLLIDDEINILRSMEMFFEDSEIEILTAKTAREGIQTIHNNTLDVVLCDLAMDDMNGLEVGKVIKKHCRKTGIPKIPFILYTGLDKKLDSRILRDAGVDRVVQKPIACEKLLHIIQSVVTEQEPTGEQQCRLDICRT
jgi:two-component system, cell cycle sensor histidine kinase and response regulator CckA